MSDYKPPASAEEEEERFHLHLAKFLEEDEPNDKPNDKKEPPKVPAPTGTPNQPPASAAPFDLDKLLEEREKRKQHEAEIGKLRADVDEMKKPKTRKWYDPFTMFSS